MIATASTPVIPSVGQQVSLVDVEGNDISGTLVRVIDDRRAILLIDVYLYLFRQNVRMLAIHDGNNWVVKFTPEQIAAVNEAIPISLSDTSLAESLADDGVLTCRQVDGMPNPS